MYTDFLNRWEDHNHGLDHKCGTCATVLSSPRAKKTCFGIHEEVCIRYHKTLFFVGQSHACEACRHSIEAHDKRHREIATIIQDIRRLDQAEAPQAFERKRQGRIESEVRPDVESTNPKHDPNDPDQEAESVEVDDASTNLDEDESDERAQGWLESQGKRAAKAERKAAKNQLRFDVITTEELGRVQEALHQEPFEAVKKDPAGQNLIGNPTIQGNLGFNTNTFQYSSPQKSAQTKRALKINGRPKKVEAVNIDQISTAILNTLGIRTSLSKAPKERKNLDAKLRIAIMRDLTAVENEQAEIMERMAGYWRYVNKRTYNQMIETNQVWDWATGQKLPKVDEECELESVEEEDERSEEGTLNDTTAATTPMTSPEQGQVGLPVANISPDHRTSTENILKTPTQASYTERSTESDELAEDTRRRFDEIQVEIPQYSPGCPPGPTLQFRVPSPSPSDDNPYIGTWVDCSIPINEQNPPLETTDVSAIQPPPQFSSTNYHGKKDTRSPNKIILIRAASPPLPKPRTRHKIWASQPPTTLPPTTTDSTNLFRNLERELPAPCEPPKKRDKPKLKGEITLMVPPKLAPVEAEGEEGWQVQKGPKRYHREFPALGGKKKR